jgi:hypothetical protein
MFKGRHFDRSVILLCVRWYLAYNLSLRNLEETIAERGISVDHATIHRLTIHYALLLLEQFNRRKRPVTGRRYIDGTYIKVHGQWLHLCALRRYIAYYPKPSALPPWADDLDGRHKVVLVTQETVANHDFGILVAPTLAALANEPDVLVVVTADGCLVEAIPGPIPANARLAGYLPFEWTCPRSTSSSPTGLRQRYSSYELWCASCHCGTDRR